MEHAGGGWQYPDIESAARQFGEGRAPTFLAGANGESGKSALIQRAATDKDIERLVARYPSRESGVFGRIANNLRYRAVEDCRIAAATRARDCSDLAKSLKRRIEPLPDAIQ